MRLLVCGGRNYDGDKAWGHVKEVLDGIHCRRMLTAIIEGGASGADSLARTWAYMNRVACITVPADWAEHGKAAGPIRNQQMIDLHKPDVVVAFPGGRGTADMVRRAVAARIGVINHTGKPASYSGAVQP